MDASTLIIFGATGDLTHRKLIPSLYHLFYQGLLPSEFNIVGYARRDQDKENFLLGLKESLQKHAKNFDFETWKRFSEKIHYVKGDLDNLKDYIALAEYLKKFDPPNSCTNKIFYLATAPSYFTPILKNLESSEVNKLLGKCWFRVIIEKPFGHDLESAQELNKLIDDKFDEKAIYRIDHYLAKETVQNILTFRFANGLFEPMWNKDYIDHIQITASEKIGVETRGGYYEESGNLRDIVQNHLLQLLALTIMEQPKDFNSESIRDARLEALKSLMPVENLQQNIVFGQYEAGHGVAGYLEEPKVDKNSTTDTFTAMKLFVNSQRWDGVPIYLRSGKRLAENAVDISIVLKEPVNKLFNKDSTIPNVLSFHIQPDEGISLRLMAKEPGHELKMEPVSMHLKYEEAFKVPEPDPYEKLILDIISGVQTLFPRADEVEAAWEFIDPIIKVKSKLPLYTYPAFSWGPDEAYGLIEGDDRGWFTH